MLLWPPYRAKPSIGLLIPPGSAQKFPRDRLYELSAGHPLMTRYLVEALRGANSVRTDAVLRGDLSFGGDVEAVYASAWREIESDTESRLVMEYIARAEGPIPPEMLAEATSEQAVERALASTRHLLDLRRDGWRVFHNSFRVFVLDRPHLRFGIPDQNHSNSDLRKDGRAGPLARGLEFPSGGWSFATSRELSAMKRCLRLLILSASAISSRQEG